MLKREFCLRARALARRANLRLNRAMVNEPDTTARAIELEAARLGLARALVLAPAVARAAIARARTALVTPPSGPLTEPAGAFDAAAHSGEQ